MRLINESVEIETSVDLVWSVLDDFGDVAIWAPYMRHSELIGEQQTGVGTRRKLRHFWGFRLEEVVTEWNDRSGFKFKVNRVPWPMKDVWETWVIQHGNGRTTVATSVEYHMKLWVPGKLLDWILVRHIVRREMRTGLKGLKDYTEQRQAGAADK
jgi:hypothetical protein